MILLLALLSSLFICLSATAADNSADVVVRLQINDPIMKVNGVEAEIDDGRGTKPVIMNGRTLTPVRAIVEAFGGTVNWNGGTQTVTLSMDHAVILLVIDSYVAYLNNEVYTLDVAPTVINDRTMLPIRFIAEGFNLGVAWEEDTQTVTLIRNTFDAHEYAYLMCAVPAYSGSPYVQINNNVPLFKDYEIIGGSFEYYSTLDNLGRCDVCIASVGNDIMPTEERGNISSITPTGWINVKYETVPGKYLYDRCHLIGYQLTGENANERNLITGTRYLNVDGMLPFENLVNDYIERTGNHVMYRVTPVFKENNLVADGVLMEGYSVEDGGQGILFCVYCYNVQPTVSIDYATGASNSGNGTETKSTSALADADAGVTETDVYRTPSGKRYHFDVDCGGRSSFSVTIEQALNDGLTPCQKCAA